MQPGTYTLTEIQPGFYTDGRDTHLGLESPTNDQFDGIVLVPSGAASDYNFGEQGVRSEFVSVFLNRRAFFASSIITGHFGPPTTTTSLNLQTGDIWVSVDGGWDGVRTYLAQFNAANGSATMTLYNNAVQKVAESTATTGGAQLTYNGTAGAAYFIRISGTNPNVSLQSIDTVSIGNVSKFEGTGGTTDFVFTVTLSGPQSQTVTANYATADGTATAASGDYTVKNGTVSFAPGETKKLITVVVSADSIQEADEKFSVLLSSPTNIAMGASTGIGTIQNDDITNFDSTMLFSGGGGSASPGVAEPGVQASTTTSPPPVSSTASTSQTAAAGSAPLYDTANSNDAALEDDEDWVTQSLLG